MIIIFRKVALLLFSDERVGWNLLIWVQRKRYSQFVVWNRSSLINVAFLLNAGQWTMSVSKNNPKNNRKYFIICYIRLKSIVQTVLDRAHSPIFSVPQTADNP